MVHQGELLAGTEVAHRLHHLRNGARSTMKISEDEVSAASTLAPAVGEVTKVTLALGNRFRNMAAETMPSTLPLVMRCLSRSSLEKQPFPIR